MMKNKAIEIFLEAVESVKPKNLMHSKLKVSNNQLIIDGKFFHLDSYEHVFLLAAGKAAALMAKEAEEILGEYISGGHVVTKYGHTTGLNRLSITEAGHPLPDINGVKGTGRLVEIACNATERDLVVFLVSGGASALMADLPEDITLHDLELTNSLLVKSGAEIAEINIVRKHLSNIKGGQLAGLIYPATTITLILSDVVGNKFDVIASGPTVPDTSSFVDMMKILRKYDLIEHIPNKVMNHINKGIEGKIAETPKLNNPIFEKVHNYIIGSNKIALETALLKATQLGFDAELVTDSLQDDYKTVANFILETIDKSKKHTSKRPICLLFGGEPTVKVTGNGLGGRNQHLALYLATKIKNMEGLTILCASTDGNDGPTCAAGAVVNHQTAKDAVKSGIDINKYLFDFDAYHFFEKTDGLIITGNTGTNVMDIIVVLIE